ncbi:MAG: hypothetical protein K9H65_02020 [Bacteroidales bacterium]|nr:hypothetical protein [Bacteroidales bacterium]
MTITAFVSPNTIVVEVPEGATTGRIKVETVGGVDESAGYYKDDNNVFMDFEEGHGCWWKPNIVSPDTTDMMDISGLYARVLAEEVAGGSWWMDPFVKVYCGSLPLEESTEPGDYLFKFEINIPESLKYVALQFTMIGSSGNYFYWYHPWQDMEEGMKTDGWETKTIPFSEFTTKGDNGVPGDASDTKPSDLSTITEFRMVPINPSDNEEPIFHVGIDNWRVFKIPEE